MNTQTIMTSDKVKVGDIYKRYYSNGQSMGMCIVVKITEKSIFITPYPNTLNHNPGREGKTSVNRYFSKGLWG